jgi:hypothetical protein
VKVKAYKKITNIKRRFKHCWYLTISQAKYAHPAGL